MDFGVWVQNPNSQNITQASAGPGQTQMDGQQQPPPPTPPNGGGSNSGDGSLFSHHVEHPGVVCDACNLGIFGFRYKCLKCIDFDLCSTCERRGLHAGHVMMRIPFPEMAAEAIRRHIGPTMGHGGMSFPFEHEREARHPHPYGGHGGHEHRPDRCRGRRRHSHSSPESSDEAKQAPAFCPYKMGKKEWKKWAKSMKKTAGVHKRSAEAFMKSAAGGSAGTTGEGQISNESGAPTGAGGSNPNPLDLTAAASQIQEFLNAFGLPIDVVELYQEWGGCRGASAQQPSASTSTQAAGSGNEAPMAETPQDTQTSTQQEIMEQFQDLTIRGETPLNLSRDASEVSAGDDLIQLTPGTRAVRTPEGEGDSEWTLVENNESGTPTNAISNAVVGTVVAESVTEEAASSYPSVPEEFRETKVFRQIPIVQEANVPHVNTSTPAPPSASAPPPTSAPGQPIYPQLGPFMPLVTGLTNAVGNVTRNIPPMPWGQVQPPNAHERGKLNEQMTATLNQLLGMGFNNDNGDLARLVQAKNGHLENVLNSLFPPSTFNN